MALLDQYGRPVQYELLKEEQAAATLAGVRNIYSIIDTSLGLTPEKIVLMLRQAEYGDPWLYLELAERMEEKDELYQGVLHTRKMAVSQLDVAIEAASDDKDDQADADFAREVLLEGDLDLADCTFAMLDALGKGFSATEIMWNTSGRNPRTGMPWWIPERLEWRDPRWFMFDWISGQQLLVRSLRTEGPEIPAGPVGNCGQPSLGSPWKVRVVSGGHEVGIQPATQPLAPFKFITHITRAKAGLPIRGGLARVAMWNYLFRNYILKDWVTFLEVYSQPLRLGKYGPGATEQDKRALLNAVANIGTDAAAIIPESMMIEFCESKQSQAHAESYLKCIEYLDKRLTIAVLGQELTTSLPRGAGSRAAAEVHDVVRRDIATDDARRLSATLSRDLVRPLIDLNRGPRIRYPNVRIGFAEEKDLALLAPAIGAFIDRGLRVSQKQIREIAGLDEPAAGEEILHPVERISSTDGSTASEQPNSLDPIYRTAPDGRCDGNAPGDKEEGGGGAARQSTIATIPLTPAFTDLPTRRESSHARMPGRLDRDFAEKLATPAPASTRGVRRIKAEE
jgi:phage gp29-like protein